MNKKLPTFRHYKAFCVAEKEGCFVLRSGKKRSKGAKGMSMGQRPMKYKHGQRSIAVRIKRKNK